MTTVITGMAELIDVSLESHMNALAGRIRQVRFVHSLEAMALSAVCSTLDDARVMFPFGHSRTGVYLGIDDAIEDIKDEYFTPILREGILGASPLLFPYTSPNALAAQISIAFDVRGESITLPITSSVTDVLQYGADCVAGEYTESAIIGAIFCHRSQRSASPYRCEFYFIESEARALKRGVHIYCSIGLRK